MTRNRKEKQSPRDARITGALLFLWRSRPRLRKGRARRRGRPCHTINARLDDRDTVGPRRPGGWALGPAVCGLAMASSRTTLVQFSAVAEGSVAKKTDTPLLWVIDDGYCAIKDMVCVVLRSAYLVGGVASWVHHFDSFLEEVPGQVAVSRSDNGE